MKRIPDFCMYAITNNGRVWSYKRHKFLSPATDHKGYLFVHISNGIQKKNFRIHRLVATAFIESVIGKKYVNHIDNDKTNNNYKNLEWCTASENMAHSYLHGRPLLRVRAKLTNDQVVELRARYINGASLSKLAKEYNLTPGGAHGIINRRTYKHI